MRAASVPKPPRRYLSRLDQAARYSVSVKTVKRWGADPKRNMPQEYDFGGASPFRAEDELEAWERGRIVALKD
jgi:hypothetical protein